MTNKERQEIKKLVRMMREAGVRYRASKPVIELLEGGADEIERLSRQEPTHRDPCVSIVVPYGETQKRISVHLFGEPEGYEWSAKHPLTVQQARKLVADLERALSQISFDDT